MKNRAPWILAIGLVVLVTACSTNTTTAEEPSAPKPPAQQAPIPPATSEADLTDFRSEIDSAMAVADEFVTKKAAGDVDGMVAMLSNIEAYDEGADPYYYEAMAQAFGQVLKGLQCVEPVEAPFTVQCNGTVLNDVQVAKDLESCTTQLSIAVLDGKVSSYTASDNCDSFYDQQWVPLESWIRANYPEHESLMYDLEGVTSHSGLMTEESRDLWFDHIDEYVTELSSGS